MHGVKERSGRQNRESTFLCNKASIANLSSCSLIFFIVPPEVTVSPQAPQVVEGKNVTLFCDATGVPKPSLKWTKDDSSTVLSESARLTLFSVDRPGNPSDPTQYHCTASNGYGDPMFKTDTATVTVICEYYGHCSCL